VKYAVPLCAALLLAGACAPATQRPPLDPELVQAEARKQRDLAVRDRLKRENRLQDITLRLLAAGAPLCGDKVRPLFGLNAVAIDEVSEEWRAAYRRALGVMHGVVIAGVVPGLPADAAGLRAGDVIVAVDGWAVPADARADGDKNDALSKLLWSNLTAKPNAVGEISDKMRQAAQAKPTFAVRVRRQDALLEAHILPANGCDYPSSFLDTEAINAYADGSKIYVTAGMMRFTDSDDELALVVGHEIAHNIMSHIDKQKGNVLLGTVLGAAVSVLTGVNVTNTAAAAARNVYSQEFEAEADYVGLYIMARAGFQIADAPNFWRRMAVAHPASIGHASSHPTSAQRFVGLETAIDEIKGKQTNNLPLHPNLKLP
jgi:beta-barrel assembly-enhancing protease